MARFRQQGFKYVCLCLFVFSFVISPVSAAKKKSSGPTQASIVICAETGTVLHSNNADAKTYPASLTKNKTYLQN